MRGPQSWLVVGVGAVVLSLALVFTKKRKLLIGVLVSVFLLGSLALIHFQAPLAKDVAVDGPWQPYSDAKLESLKGQNVFVDMTADWCLTCKVNERLVLDQPDVQEVLRQHGVTLLKGDWTNRNPEITMFLNRYQRVGVPFYVLYSARHPDGLVLPEVLVKTSFIELINKEFQK